MKLDIIQLKLNNILARTRKTQRIIDEKSSKMLKEHVETHFAECRTNHVDNFFLCLAGAQTYLYITLR